MADDEVSDSDQIDVQTVGTSSEVDTLLSPHQPSRENDDVYERTIKSCGFGWFQIKLLLVCGWGLASDSVEVQTVSFVISSACDLHLTSSDKGWLNAVIFVGMMIGGYCFGGSADIKGRRFILMISMTMNGLFGLASAFCPTFGYFLACRLLSGVGVGAAMPVLFSYFVEFFSREQRGPFIGLLATWWMVGNIITSGLAWAIIPQTKVGGDLFGMWFGSWRIFTAICALPSISSAIFFMTMPESPKFLQKVARYKDAEKVFEKMFRANSKGKKNLPAQIKDFSSHHEINLPHQKDAENSNTSFSGFFQSMLTTLAKVFLKTIRLFKKPYTTASIVLIIIWFTLSFGYYGLWMWFPEIFRRIKNGGSSCGGGSVVMNHTTSPQNCTETVANDNEVYFQSFMIAISNLPGNLITVLIINKLGRRSLLAVSMVLSAVCVFFFWMAKTTTHMLAISCVFSGLSVAGWNALDALALEQYPTDLRSTAFGFQASVGRVAAVLGNVAFGAMVDLHCSVPLLTVAAFLFLGGLSVFKLKRSDQSSLQ